MDHNDRDLQPVLPGEVLRQIVSQLPESCRQYIIIIGSLAAGYHFFKGHEEIPVRTKDADFMLSPRVNALSAGRCIVEQLIAHGWEYRPTDEFPEPGNSKTPDNELPAVRLRPPKGGDWFLELITIPETVKNDNQKWMRLETPIGHFGIPSFDFLILPNYEPIYVEELGINIARPAMMALANLLEHPEIEAKTMSGLFAGRRIKRSNKDLGRVIALAWLDMKRDEACLEQWLEEWQQALRALFPTEWTGLAGRLGSGLRALLASPSDLDEALHTCVYGLLAGMKPTLLEYKTDALRLLQDVVIPVEESVLQG